MLLRKAASPTCLTWNHSSTAAARAIISVSLVKIRGRFDGSCTAWKRPPPTSAIIRRSWSSTSPPRPTVVTGGGEGGGAGRGDERGGWGVRVAAEAPRGRGDGLGDHPRRQIADAAGGGPAVGEQDDVLLARLRHRHVLIGGVERGEDLRAA